MKARSPARNTRSLIIDMATHVNRRGENGAGNDYHALFSFDDTAGGALLARPARGARRMSTVQRLPLAGVPP